MKKGALFVITSGAYSNYQFHAHGKALRHFVMKSVVKEWVKAHPNESLRYGAEFNKFVAWLLNTSGLAEEIDVTLWHLGDYGTWTDGCTETDEEYEVRRKKFHEELLESYKKR